MESIDVKPLAIIKYMAAKQQKQIHQSIQAFNDVVQLQ
jgi:hypothetical protein